MAIGCFFSMWNMNYWGKQIGKKIPTISRFFLNAGVDLKENDAVGDESMCVCLVRDELCHTHIERN